MYSNDEPRAMPLASFIEEAIALLGTDADEVVVEQGKAFRNNPGPDEHQLVTYFNDMMASEPPAAALVAAE